MVYKEELFPPIEGGNHSSLLAKPVAPFVNFMKYTGLSFSSSKTVSSLSAIPISGPKWFKVKP